MLGNILEISNKSSKNGRVPIKVALHKIHDDTQETNANGLHWKKEYVLNALDSAKGMPFCAELDEEKETPFGHGLTGEEVISDGIKEPVFENSEVVGVCENATIETIKDKNGNDIEAVCANGFLYSQRYPKFVSWLRKNYALGNVDTSIEIMGIKENDNKIVYEEENPSDTYRTPQIYCYTGDAFLSITPADDSAILLEISEKKQNKEDKETMEFNMDEIKSTIHSTISELNDKSQDYETQIAELNSTIEAKDSELAEKDAKISELNASVEQIQATLDQLKKDHETYWAEREILEQELAKAKVAEKLGELDTTLSDFSEDEKAVAKEDIDKLTSEINAATKKEDLENVTSEINSIKSKICMNIVETQKKAEADAKIAEQNSVKEDVVEDIFSEVCSESHKDEEDTNIF